MGLPDQSFSASSCSAPQPQGFLYEKITCEIKKSDSAGYYILRILNAFRQSSGPAGENYVVSLPGVQNPIFLTPTPPFTISTFTSDGYGVDSFSGAGI